MKKICLLLATAMIILVGGCSEPMTDEELAVYRANCIQNYDVLSVFQYAKPVTNGFGGIIRVDVCYAFTYLDSSGNLQSVNGFQNLEYGLTKVCYGESDKYVVDSYDNTKYLYLSPATLSSLSGKEG